MNYFYDVDQEYDEPWYNDDLSVTGTTVPGENTDLQYSYNLGYSASVVGFSLYMVGVGAYAGLTTSFMMAYMSNMLYLVVEISSAMMPVLRFGARTIPVLGLIYLLLQMGESANTSQRSWTERSHEQRVADAPKVHN